MLAFIKYALVLILIIYVLSSEFFIGLISRLKNFVVNVNTEIFSHLNDEVFLLLLMVVFGTIYMIVMSHRD